jgi:hypothetical protein
MWRRGARLVHVAMRSGQPMRTIQEFLGHHAPSAHEVEMVSAAFAEDPPVQPERAGTDPLG